MQIIPLKFLDVLQQQFVPGRALEVASEDEVNEGETNFIMVDHFKLVGQMLSSTFFIYFQM